MGLGGVIKGLKGKAGAATTGAGVAGNAINKVSGAADVAAGFEEDARLPNSDQPCGW